MYVMGYETPSLPTKVSPISINSSLYDEALNIEILFCDGNCTPAHMTFAITEPFYEKLPLDTITGKLKDFVSWILASMLTKLLLLLMDKVPSFRAKMQTSVGMLVSLMKPMSIGSVKIRSNNPSDLPLIDSAFLKEKEDMDALRKGVALAKKLTTTAPFSDIVGKSLMPIASPDETEEIRMKATTYHHSTGTCSIGRCLDDKLAVKGVRGLRVADASSLPFHPRVPPNASCMALGARCASIIARDIAKT
mmetsp:Transcript_31661/g.54001  ORF Transcript_31661/g.54001 Transcript_31661/m.54001 type:complete len:249 (-) Transcript_31661:154-900(-)